MKKHNKKQIPMAIAYDFDGTLSPGNMQEYGFMRKLGYKDPTEFWSKCQELAKKQQADSVLAYMKTMLDESARKGVSFSKRDFCEYGRSVRLFKGVSTWFSRINAYAAERGICLKHYIISSGLKEMIEGTSIAKEFDKIFASSFMYDEKGVAFWAGVAINYTTKTQFLFRINKGCLDINDNKGINHYLPQKKRAVPFSQMVYIGDGTTDIPCMRVVKSSGGYAIAVYQACSTRARATSSPCGPHRRTPTNSPRPTAASSPPATAPGPSPCPIATCPSCRSAIASRSRRIGTSTSFRGIPGSW